MIIQENCNGCGAPLQLNKCSCEYCGSSFHYSKHMELGVVVNRPTYNLVGQNKTKTIERPDCIIAKTNSNNKNDSWNSLTTKQKAIIIATSIFIPYTASFIKRKYI